MLTLQPPEAGGALQTSMINIFAIVWQGWQISVYLITSAPNLLVDEWPFFLVRALYTGILISYPGLKLQMANPPPATIALSVAISSDEL